MQKNINPKLVNPKFINSQVFCFLLVACIALHVGSMLATPAHPTVALLLSICENLGWFFVLLIGAVFVGRGLKRLIGVSWSYIKRLVCATCAHATTFVRAHVHFQLKKKTFVSVKKLEQLRTQVQVFGLALYGTTSEKETARLNAYKLLGQAAPDLVLPRSNVALQGEFDEGLIRFLNRVGFPHLENVRLQKSEFEFVNVWINDLFDRLYQLQKISQEAHVALDNDLTVAELLLQSILRKSPAVESDSDYNRLVGAVRVLKAMSDIPCGQLYPYVKALLRDINTFSNKWSNAVA